VARSRRILISTLVCSLSVSFTAPAVVGQTLEDIRPGDRLRIRSPVFNGEVTFVGWHGNVLTLRRYSNGIPTEYQMSLPDILRVEQFHRRSRSDGAIIGAATGAAILAPTGAVLCRDAGFIGPMGCAVIFGVVGATGGGAGGVWAVTAPSSIRGALRGALIGATVWGGIAVLDELYAGVEDPDLLGVGLFFASLGGAGGAVGGYTAARPRWMLVQTQSEAGRSMEFGVRRSSAKRLLFGLVIGVSNNASGRIGVSR
jgi:hypothetical protein